MTTLAKKSISDNILIKHDQVCDWLQQSDERLRVADEAKEFPDDFDNELVIQILSELAEQGRAMPAIQEQCKAWLKLKLSANDQRNVVHTQVLLSKLIKTHQRLLFLMEHFNPRLVNALFEEAIQSMLGESAALPIEKEDQLH